MFAKKNHILQNISGKTFIHKNRPSTLLPKKLHPFQANFQFLYPLKTLENQKHFQGTQNETLGQNRLMKYTTSRGSINV